MSLRRTPFTPLVYVRGRLRPLVKVDLTAALLYGLFGGMTAPFFTVIARRLGAEPLAISLLVAAPALGMLLSLLWVRFLRRWSAVTVLMWSGLLSRGVFLFSPLVRTNPAYIGLVSSSYAIASAIDPAYAQVIGEIYPAEERGRILGIVRTGMALTWIVASLVGGRLLQSVSFRWVFVLASLFGIAGSLVYRRFHGAFQHLHTEAGIPSGAFVILRSNPHFRRFLTAFFIYGTGYWLITPALPLFYVDVLGATNFQVGVLAATTSLFWLLSYRPWGRIIDRRTAIRTLWWAFALGTLAPLVYLVAPNVWILLIAAMADGVVTAGINLLWLSALLEIAPRHEVSSFTALHNTFVGIRGSVVPFISGILLTIIPVRGIFALAVLMVLVSIWLAYRLPSRPTTGSLIPPSASWEDAPSKAGGSR